MKSTILLHQEYHSKDASRSALQKARKETCSEIFKNLLGTDQSMIAYHQPLNLKDLQFLAE